MTRKNRLKYKRTVKLIETTGNTFRLINEERKSSVNAVNIADAECQFHLLILSE